MSDTQPALACDLGALGVDERARRSALASRVALRFREILEISDGYAARIDPDPTIVRDALEWLLLERRCCPFLHLDLCFEPSDGPVWFRFRGGLGTKEFLAAGVELLAEYQSRLAAQDTYALLVVLQAMDAAGKDGTIRHVMSGVNPQGVEVNSFKAEGPFFHGDQFALLFHVDVTRKADKERIKMDEVALYKVKDGKIVEERFFY